MSWLREVICREYAQVEVTLPARQILSQDLRIYPWNELRLSVVQCNGVALERLPRAPQRVSQDCYFAVVLISGNYCLEQDGREAVLRPGDMTLYDATRPHRIQCPGDFVKLILSIPRPLLRERMPDIEHCTALPMPGAGGIGAVTSNFLRASSQQADELTTLETSSLAEQALDLLTLSAASARPASFAVSRSRSVSMRRVKLLIEKCLADCDLDTAIIARRAGLSARYVNALFGDEGTSLMRYVWRLRLENCAKDMQDPRRAGDAISDIAFRWGFNDASHFSRAFRRQFGRAPREFRQRR
ncbi:helix-turn-helix domain-containing protein [Methylocapsa aurea]|uniref:AraC-like ligand-binding domain-containing protein n=1 Tax=Methylocapsa aurea TaxID=663610 RepID=UPI001FDA82B5|nr:helix-turn-helix domain-containing protein [Methylocapsa aurea]